MRKYKDTALFIYFLVAMGFAFSKEYGAAAGMFICIELALTRWAFEDYEQAEQAGKGE